MFGILPVLLLSTFAIWITLKFTTGSFEISHERMCDNEVAEQLRMMQRDITNLKEHNNRLEREIRELTKDAQARDKKQSVLRIADGKIYYRIHLYVHMERQFIIQASKHSKPKRSH